jgi:hypothetical protein
MNPSHIAEFWVVKVMLQERGARIASVMAGNNTDYFWRRVLLRHLRGQSTHPGNTAVNDQHINSELQLLYHHASLLHRSGGDESDSSTIQLLPQDKQECDVTIDH